MRIGITGYGSMGRMIHSSAVSRGHTVPLIIDPHSSSPEVTDRSIGGKLSQVDVMIDFSVPGEVIDHVRQCSEARIPMVIGTTGWYDRIDEAEQIVLSHDIGCIWSGNYALGVHLFFRIVEAAATAMDDVPEYDCMVHEYFHRRKVDSPSGTAQMLGELLLKHLKRKKRIVTESLNRKIEEDELHVSSTRGGSIPGIHTVTFDSDVDTIEITHRARGREGFVLGAVKAAEWIVSRKGFFSIDDMLKNMLGLGE